MMSGRFFIVFACVLGLPVVPALSQAGGPTPKFTSYQSMSAAHPGSTAQLALEVELGESWHVNSNEPLDEFAIPTILTVDPPEPFALQRVVYPPHVMYTFAFSPEPVAAFEHTFAIGVELLVDESVAPGDYTIPAKLRYQACNDTQCFMPLTVDVELTLTVAPAGTPVEPQHQAVFENLDFSAETAPPDAAPRQIAPEESVAAPVSQDWKDLADTFELTGLASGYMGSSDFIALVDQVDAGEAATDTKLFQGKNVWVVVGLTLLGGLGLNLTPCVLPIIPITIAIIGAGAQAKSRSRGFFLGGAYGLGMAFAYGVLGIIVVVTAGAFGVINASPWFNLAIAVLFVILALAMFDKIFIDFSRFQSKLAGKRNEGGSILIALGFGAVSALLAGACVAPVVIYVVTYSADLYAQGQTIALLLPFLLGAGMALPWPFAGAGLSFLPKPGKWMVRVKQAFGVLILLVAAWYGKEAYTLFSERWVDAGEVEASAAALDETGWLASLPAGLALAQEENRPVLIDFWATWCKSCQTMNLTTFRDPAVIERLEDYVKIKYQAEDMSVEPTKSVLEYYDVKGLPTYVFLKPQNGG
jgi:thioredoxin:protein disulfide reductase